MGEGGRKLAREDLEAMRQEFVVGERAGSLDDDLHQIRRSARLGVSPEDWARARKVDPCLRTGPSEVPGSGIESHNRFGSRKISLIWGMRRLLPVS